jgi:hypothetical protein
MLRQSISAVILVLFALLLPSLAGAQQAGADPATFLPRGTMVLKTETAEVTGDGRDDVVALYAYRAPSANVSRGGVLILRATDAGVEPVHLFGQPPDRARGEPTLDPNGSADLTLQDLTGDGRAEIVLTATSRFQGPTPRTSLWVFGAGLVPVPPDDDLGLPAPTWAGTGFKLEAFLEGNTVTVLSPQAGSPSPASALRREITEQRLGGPAPAVTVSETFYWRNDGFRLGARSLSLPDPTAIIASSPEAAVLSFYQAVGRGDLQTATGLLGDELRASRSAPATNNPSAPSTEMRIEELRLAHDYLTGRDGPDDDREVYVRVSLADPRTEPPAAPNPQATTSPQGRQTDAGIWRVRKEGDQWRLIAGTLHQTADLVTISDALPPGVTPIQTDGGDLRGRGIEDLAVLLTEPGRFANVQPFVLFGTAAGGFEPGVPLASYLGTDPYGEPIGDIGGPAGSIAVDDVNRDGTLEVTFSGIVGAHSAVLWVLRWDGSTLAPLFAEASNSPTVGLEDLDADGVAEVVLGQSGYCGGYASSPRLTFAFRWEDGAYRSASWRYASLAEGIEEFAGDLLSNPHGAPDDARVCVEHMLATAHAFGGRGQEARTAYRAYAEHRQQLSEDARRFVRPSYLAAPYVEADLRAVLAAIQAGQISGWGPAELAILHDLLGDALTEQANGYRSIADSLADRGKEDLAREARRKSSEARQAATTAYEAALALDPADPEARRALGQ